MFTYECSTALLKNCISSNMAGKCPNFMKQLIQLVDKHDGCIFGSVITAYLLQDNQLKNAPPRDVDILLRDVHAYNAFIIEANVLLKTSMPTFRNSKCRVEMSQRKVLYTFTNMLADGEGCDTKIKLIAGDNRTPLISMHVVYLKSGANPRLTSIHSSVYVQELFDSFFKLNFTKTVYYKGKIYSHLSSIKTVEESTTNIDTKEKERLIEKYELRGIKFIKKMPPPVRVTHNVNTIEAHATINDEPTTEMKPDYIALAAAKKRYQNMGLVVIPLSRGKRQDGKAPGYIVQKKNDKRMNWMDCDRSYDFSIKSCANIGIVCGPNSGIVCIDVDQKDNGMHYFNKMAARYGMPTCPTQSTPNGGRHYIFRYDNARMRGMVAKIKGCVVNGNKVGIDLWIDRCQFVASPSINYLNGKMYKWIVPFNSRDDLPDLPEWIYDLYNYKNVTEDGEIIKDVISDTTSEVLADDQHSEFTHTPRVLEPVHQTVGSYGIVADDVFVNDKVSFEIDVKSIPWLTMAMLAILIIIMSITIIIAVAISLLFFLIVPSNMKASFKRMFVKIFVRALDIFN